MRKRSHKNSPKLCSHFVIGSKDELQADRRAALAKLVTFKAPLVFEANSVVNLAISSGFAVKLPFACKSR